MSTNKQTHEDLFAEMLERFDLSDEEDTDREDSAAVTFWIPTEYKDKYDQIQDRSKRKFHKFLKRLFIRQIESVKI